MDVNIVEWWNNIIAISVGALATQQCHNSACNNQLHYTYMY